MDERYLIVKYSGPDFHNHFMMRNKSKLDNVFYIGKMIRKQRRQNKRYKNRR